MRPAALLLMCCAAFAALPVLGQVTRCTDARTGKVTYTDGICGSGEAAREVEARRTPEEILQDRQLSAEALERKQQRLQAENEAAQAEARRAADRNRERATNAPLPQDYARSPECARSRRNYDLVASEGPRSTQEQGQRLEAAQRQMDLDCLAPKAMPIWSAPAPPSRAWWWCRRATASAIRHPIRRLRCSRSLSPPRPSSRHHGSRSARTTGARTTRATPIRATARGASLARAACAAPTAMAAKRPAERRKHSADPFAHRPPPACSAGDGNLPFLLASSPPKCHSHGVNRHCLPRVNSGHRHGLGGCPRSSMTPLPVRLALLSLFGVAGPGTRARA